MLRRIARLFIFCGLVTIANEPLRAAPPVAYRGAKILTAAGKTFETGTLVIQDGKIDPSFVITHRLSLADAPNGYDTFRNNQNECIKVVMTTNGSDAVH